MKVKITDMNKVINYSFTLLLFIISGCTTNNHDIENNTVRDRKVIEILSGPEIPNIKNYAFSPEAIFLADGNAYSLKGRALYNQNGEIQKLIIYKPEGLLEYRQEDISKDLRLLEYYGFPIKQQWHLTKGHLIDINGNLIVTVMRVTDSIYKATGVQRSILYIIE